ncbi:MAG TPA: carboxypeptidase-like regulatory domain-containing protein [Acidobacteriota bacterium]|nr:carboxypeptidase-like regulatory domain-containing protein [Acidobacteriota bacterium]
MPVSSRLPRRFPLNPFLVAPRSLKLLIGLSLGFFLGLFTVSAAAQTTVQGRIVDPQGQPLQGITVLLHPHQDRYQAGLAQLRLETERPVAARAMTDSRGLFHMQIPEESMWSLSVQEEGYLPMHLRETVFQPGFSLPDLVLYRSQVRRLGVSKRREPVPGAVIRVQGARRRNLPALQTTPWVPLPQVRVSDDQGWFDFQMLPGGEPGLRAWAPGSAFSATVYQSSKTQDRVLAQIGLAPGEPLHLRVSDPSERPLPDVLVFRHGWAESISDQQGRLTIYPNPDTESDREMLQFVGPGGWSLTTPIKPSNPPQQLVLSPPRQLSLRLTDRDSGRPVSDAVIWIPDQSQASRCNSVGQCQIDAWSSSSQMWVDAVGYQAQRLNIIRQMHLNVELRKTAVVSGTVAGPGGSPLGGARIQARRQGGASSWVHTQFVAYGWTRDDGSFFLELPTPAPEIALKASFPDLGSEVVRTRGKKVDLRLTQGAEVFGIVVDRQGHPVPEALVSVHTQPASGFPQAQLSRGGPLADLQTRSDASGRFHIGGLSPGRLLISVWSSSQTLSSAVSPPFTLSEGDQVKDVGEIGLPPTRTLSGEVVDTSGEPLAGATVSLTPDQMLPGIHWRLTGEAPDRWTAVTDAQGRFQLEGAPQHPVWAKVDAQGYKSGRAAFANPVQESMIITLGRGVTVRGRLVNPQGEPVKRASVHVMHRSLESPPLYWNAAAIMSTDQEGRFESANLAEGHFKIDVRLPGMAVLTEPIGVLREAEEKDVEIVIDRKRIVVQGRVLTPEGEPVRRASAELHLKDSQEYPRDRKGRATVVDGRFEIAVPQTGTYLLTVKNEDIGAQQVELDLREGVEAVDVLLDPSNLVRFQVVDAQGNPVSEAYLKVLSEDQFVHSLRARDGSAVLDFYQPLSGEVLAETTESWARAGFQSGSGQPVTVQLRLRPKVPVEGQVTGLDQGQLRGLRVHLNGDTAFYNSPQVQVDKDGTIVCPPLAPGEYAVDASVTNGPRMQSTLTVTADQERAWLDLEFEPGVEARFQLLGNGQPLATRFSLMDFARPVATGQSGPRGEISLRGLQPGEYQLLFMGDFGLRTEPVTIPDDAGKVFDLELIDISGTLLDPSGQPVAGARVWQARNILQVMNRGRDGPRSDLEGRFEIRGVLAKAGPLVISHSDFALNSAALPETSQGNGRDLEISLQAGGTGYLQMQDLGQIETTRFMVMRLSEDGILLRQDPLELKEGNRLEVGQLAPAGSRLLVAHPSVVPIELTLRPHEVMQVRTEPAAQVKVTVPAEFEHDPRYMRLLDQQGRPLSSGLPRGAAISYLTGAPEGAWPVHDRIGHAASLPPGDWILEVVFDNGAKIQRSLSLLPGETHEVQLP